MHFLGAVPRAAIVLGYGQACNTDLLAGTGPSSPGYPESLTTSDLDDDGHPDVVVTIEGDGHKVLYGQRGGLSSHKP
ncbi:MULTISPECIES: hypothetical protein [unclassified Streptomyces]|uniref:hypothetical protein n=1 Tax=unclassified Streptomyces TaxID=2593676 RepID=UPI00364001CD